MSSTLIIVALSLFCALLLLLLLRLKYEFNEYRKQEAERLGEARQKAIEQSRAVLGGKFAEQLTPYLPDFRYDPTEARFIGSPLDFVVFPGMAQGEPREVVFLEVKTGKSKLTPAERKLQKLIEAGKVRWELIQHYPERGKR